MKFRYIVQKKPLIGAGGWVDGKYLRRKTGLYSAVPHRTKAGALADLRLWKLGEGFKERKYRFKFRIIKRGIKTKTKPKKRKYKRK